MNSAKARLIAHTEAQTTEHLVTGMLALDAKSTGPGYAGLAREEVIVLHTIFDVLAKRYPAADARMEAWFCDESPEGIDFIMSNSYADLLALAIAESGVKIN